MEGKDFLKIKIAGLIISGIFLSPNLNLAKAASYGASPMIMDIKAEARDIIKKSITITSDSENKLDLYPVVNNVLVDESGLQEFKTISEADKSISLANWIEFPRAIIELESGESKTIVFSIQVNLEAKPGIYHARISFPEGSTREQAEQKIDESPFVTINLEVTEKVNELLELRKFLPSKTFFLNLPASLVYSVENIGNKEIVPKGEVILYDRKGKEVGSLAVNIEGKKVSPGNVLDFRSDFEEGNYFGKYKAFLNINYGSNHRGTLNDTIYFYLIPWQKLTIALSVVVAMAWLLSVWIHKRRNHGSSRPDSLSHVIFHPQHVSPSRSIGSDYFDKLGKEVGRNRNHVAVNGRYNKNHNSQHGHVMDLRHHRKK